MPRPLYSRVVIKWPNIREKDLTKEGVWGQAFKELHEIDIEKNQWDKQKFKTALHECVHCLLPDLKEFHVLKIEHIWGNILWDRFIRRFIKKHKNKCNKKG